MQLSIQVVVKGGTFWIPCANDHLELNEPEKYFFDTKSFEYAFFFYWACIENHEVGDPINDLTHTFWSRT